MRSSEPPLEIDEHIPEDLKGREEAACKIAGVDPNNLEARRILWQEIINWDYDKPADGKIERQSGIECLQLLRQTEVFLKARGSGKGFSSPVNDLLAGGRGKKQALRDIKRYKNEGFAFNKWESMPNSIGFRKFVAKHQVFLGGNVGPDEKWYFSQHTQFTPQVIPHEDEFMPTSDDIPANLNTIYYGPPGTGKTWKVRKILEKHFSDRYVSVTFHQSYSYEDFVEGIRPVLDSDSVKYERPSGIFKKICKRAQEDSDQAYALFIDEINRGNISKIFGELITLIEENKRWGADEEMEATLPGSGEKLCVPKNLYIIGTMNTADRSLAMMDTALRRRFSFIPVYPDPKLLQDKRIGKVDLAALLEVINTRIETLIKDSEHGIGHSYLLHVEDIVQLADVFRNKIIPLLKEYFFEDYKNIRLVLGNAPFFNRKGPDPFLQKELGEELPELWETNEAAFKEEENYIKIYEYSSE